MYKMGSYISRDDLYDIEQALMKNKNGSSCVKLIVDCVSNCVSNCVNYILNILSVKRA